jgi:G patch domain/KOW motif-containing protein
MHLPFQATFKEYQQMPIEEFGAALLRGMGYVEGQSIGRGRSQYGVKELQEPTRRPDRLGLGAQLHPDMNLKKSRTS